MLTVVLAAALSGAPGPGLWQVSARDADGAEAPGLSAAVARALVETGATVIVGPKAAPHCDPRCVRLAIERRAPGKLVLQARRGPHRARITLELPATTSAYELGHAVAVQARLLADWPSDAPPESLASPTRPEAEGRPRPEAEARPRPEAEARPRPEAEARPGLEAEARPRPEAEPPPLAPGAPSPATGAESPAAAPLASAAVSGPRLALQVAATALTDNDVDLLVGGVTVGAEVLLVEPLRFACGVAFLLPASGHDVFGWYRLRLLPISARLELELPWVSGLRVGAGVALMDVDIDRRDAEGEVERWLPGGMVRIGYVRRIGLFSVVVAARAAVHERLGSGSDPDTLFAGLELGVLLPLL